MVFLVFTIQNIFESCLIVSDVADRFDPNDVYSFRARPLRRNACVRGSKDSVRVMKRRRPEVFFLRVYETPLL